MNLLAQIQRFVFLLFLLLPASNMCAGTYNDGDSFGQAVSGDSCIPSDYLAGFPAPDPIEDFVAFDDGSNTVEHSWGSQTFVATGQIPAGQIPDGAAAIFDNATPLGVIAEASHSVVFVPDTSIGQVTGFCFDYADTLQGGLAVTVFDGIAEIDSFTLNASRGFVGWTAGPNQNATRIEVRPSSGVEFYTVESVEFCFDAGVSSNQSKLQNIIDALSDDLPDARRRDRRWIRAALEELESAQDARFWTNGDRLSDEGCGFFNRIFYATYFLEGVRNADSVVDDLNAIQDLLGCIVDAEIEFALSHPGADTNLVQYAEYFADYADRFADAGCYLRAVILHFYAWLFASYAT